MLFCQMDVIIFDTFLSNLAIQLKKSTSFLEVLVKKSIFAE